MTSSTTTTTNCSISSRTVIRTTEMHSAGEPLRIVESSAAACYPDPIPGRTLLDRRRYVSERLDAVRRFLMWEPRGHRDMYGAVIVAPDADADLAVLFMHNEGYSTMCGHAVIALGRYAVDRNLATTAAAAPSEHPASMTGCDDDGEERGGLEEVPVRIQCPCGVVTAFVERTTANRRTTGRVRFHSVPAFAFALGVEVELSGIGGSDDRQQQAQVVVTNKVVTVDIGYGGAFYAIVVDRDIGVDVRRSTTVEIVRAATIVSDAVKAKVKLYHPDSDDLAFLYGTIVTDGEDVYSSDKATVNLTVFADQEVDRAPTGSGVTARVAVQFARHLIELGQRRTFESAANGSRYTGQVVRRLQAADWAGTGRLQFPAVTVEVSGTAYYSGTATFTAEDGDDLKDGFLLR
jgi:trans-L-3-hydroxyproline dehydratase